ncbi:hypothetical protein [Phocaeicola paurosaccharolyticus]|uniref:hypothetical protein n=1 Tax=Phocaeicola paurosaccharolyticus TaxID=732242 RepID=UPI00131EF167|nr:hypothetical protein [Phocaeicola paurosaccharolyticus]
MRKRKVKEIHDLVKAIPTDSKTIGIIPISKEDWYPIMQDKHINRDIPIIATNRL